MILPLHIYFGITIFLVLILDYIQDTIKKCENIIIVLVLYTAQFCISLIIGSLILYCIKSLI